MRRTRPLYVYLALSASSAGVRLCLDRRQSFWDVQPGSRCLSFISAVVSCEQRLEWREQPVFLRRQFPKQRGLIQRRIVAKFRWFVAELWWFLAELGGIVAELWWFLPKFRRFLAELWWFLPKFRRFLAELWWFLPKFRRFLAKFRWFVAELGRLILNRIIDFLRQFLISRLHH